MSDKRLTQEAIDRAKVDAAAERLYSERLAMLEENLENILASVDRMSERTNYLLELVERAAKAER